MYDIMTIVLGIAGMFAIVGAVAYFLQDRANRKGNLFTGTATPGARIGAFILGLLFAAAFAAELLFADRVHLVLPLLTILLIGYSLGLSSLIEWFQGGRE